MKPFDRQQALLIASYGIVLLAGLNTGWMGPLLPAIAKVQNIPIASLGSLFSIQFLGCVSSMLFSKKAIDLIGARKAIIIAATFAFTGMICMSIKASPIFLWLGALLFGGSGGINSIAGTIIALRLSKSNSASALNKLHLFFGIGALTGPLIGWAMLNTPLSYSGVFSLGACLAFSILALTIFSSELPRRETERPVPPSKTTLKETVLWLFSISLFFYVGIETGAAAWLFVYLIKASQLPHSQAALGMSALWLGLTAGRFLSGALCKNHNPQSVSLIFMVVSITAIGCLTAFPKISIYALLVVLLIGLGFGPIFPTVVALVNLRYPDSEALVTTVTISTAFLGGMLFPWIAGYVFHGMGMQIGMGFLAVGALFMIILFLIAIAFAGKKPVLYGVEQIQ